MSEYTNIFSTSTGILIVILFFGGSIFVHELGHFLAAKLCGLKVLRFSIGFGLKLFSWRGKDGCEYRLSLLPLGGYVAIPQLSDMGKMEGEEDEDFKKIKHLPKASYGAKVLVAFSGAFFNVLFAIFLALIVYIVGIPTSTENQTTQIGYVPQFIFPDGETQMENSAFTAGVQAGDIVLAVDGKHVENFIQIREAVALGAERTPEGKPFCELLILRGEEELRIGTLPVLVPTNSRTGDEIRMLGIIPASRLIVDSVFENSPAEKSGLQSGDEILFVNGQRAFSNNQIVSILNKNPEKPLLLGISRDGKDMQLSVMPTQVAKTKPLCEVLDANKNTLFTVLPTDIKNNQDPTNPSTPATLRVFEKKNDLSEHIEIGAILYQASGKDLNSLSDLNTILNFEPEKNQHTLKFIKGEFLSELVLEKGASSVIIASKFSPMLGYMIARDLQTIHPSIIKQIKNSMSTTYYALKGLVNPRSDIGLKQMSGPIGIGRAIFEISKIDIILVLSFAVLLNINLAILNLLPIPILDGGHILIATIEKVTGKSISQSKIIAITHMVFALLFVSLMVYVVYSDAQRWSGDINSAQQESLQSQFYLNNIQFSANE